MIHFIVYIYTLSMLLTAWCEYEQGRKDWQETILEEYDLHKHLYRIAANVAGWKRLSVNTIHRSAAGVVMLH